MIKMDYKGILRKSVLTSMLALPFVGCAGTNNGFLPGARVDSSVPTSVEDFVEPVNYVETKSLKDFVGPYIITTGSIISKDFVGPLPYDAESSKLGKKTKDASLITRKDGGFRWYHITILSGVALSLMAAVYASKREEQNKPIIPGPLKNKFGALKNKFDDLKKRNFGFKRRK
jgi:hypothetical protein